jgi:hypothetical protein
MQETLKLTGKLTIVMFDEYGVVKETHVFPNLVVTTGLAHIASRITGTTQSVMSHMEIGTSTSPAASEQEALVNPLAGGRQPLDSFLESGPSVTAVATFGPGQGTGAVTEAGIFNASSAGVMLCRSVFLAVNKSAGDTMSITWTITLS